MCEQALEGREKKKRRAYLVEGDSKVNGDEVSSNSVHEDVVEVAIAETDYVPDDGRRRDASRVVEPQVEPERGDLVLMEEDMPHDGRQFLEDLQVGGYFQVLPVGCDRFLAFDADELVSHVGE